MENNTNYPLYIKNLLSSYNYEEYKSLTPETNVILKFHQFIIQKFFIENNPRGLLFFYSMSQGKTLTALFIAKQLKDYDTIILSPKSTHYNFVKELKNLNFTESQIKDEVTFISLNSSNMINKINELNTDEIYDNFLNKFNKNFNSLEGKCLIVDEAHNFFNSITNNSRNAIQLYDKIMKTKNMKLIFLSGTPIVNSPLELVPCFNMLKGEMLFSEDDEEFENFFINGEEIKNKEKFQNRIFGLCSYFGEEYFNSKNLKEDFPIEKPMIVEKVNMSGLQYLNYLDARKLEKEEDKKKFNTKKERFGNVKNVSTFRIRSCQISNFCIPEYAYEGKVKNIDKIHNEDLLDLKTYSPKMLKVLENIKKNEGMGFVYSRFTSFEGLGVFAKILDLNGYEEFKEGGDIKDFESKSEESEKSEKGVEKSEESEKDEKSNESNEKDVTGNYFEDFIKSSSKKNKRIKKIKSGNNPLKKYAILTGNVLPEDRIKIIEIFNSPENKYGNLINLLLVSSVISEGVELKRVNHVHILEPYWNMLKINQIKTRAIRYKSHFDLPKEKQYVQTYIYLSDYPENIKKITEKTTDIQIFENAIKNLKLIKSFEHSLIESSIDCNLYKSVLNPELTEKIDCLLCNATNEILYYKDIKKDMMLPNNCKKFNTKKIKVNEVIVNDEKFYYTKNEGLYKIYRFNKELDNYVEVKNFDEIYNVIIEKLVNVDE